MDVRLALSKDDLKMYGIPSDFAMSATWRRVHHELALDHTRPGNQKRTLSLTDFKRTNFDELCLVLNYFT